MLHSNTMYRPCILWMPLIEVCGRPHRSCDGPRRYHLNRSAIHDPILFQSWPEYAFLTVLHRILYFTSVLISCAPRAILDCWVGLFISLKLTSYISISFSISFSCSRSPALLRSVAKFLCSMDLAASTVSRPGLSPGKLGAYRELDKIWRWTVCSHGLSFWPALWRISRNES